MARSNGSRTSIVSKRFSGSETHSVEETRMYSTRNNGKNRRKACRLPNSRRPDCRPPCRVFRATIELDCYDRARQFNIGIRKLRRLAVGSHLAIGLECFRIKVIERRILDYGFVIGARADSSKKDLKIITRANDIATGDSTESASLHSELFDIDRLL